MYVFCQKLSLFQCIIKWCICYYIQGCTPMLFCVDSSLLEIWFPQRPNGVNKEPCPPSLKNLPHREILLLKENNCTLSSHQLPIAVIAVHIPTYPFSSWGFRNLILNLLFILRFFSSVCKWGTLLYSLGDSKDYSHTKFCDRLKKIDHWKSRKEARIHSCGGLHNAPE